jgi:hypothetical protein
MRHVNETGFLLVEHVEDALEILNFLLRIRLENLIVYVQHYTGMQLFLTFVVAFFGQVNRCDVDVTRGGKFALFFSNGVGLFAREYDSFLKLFYGGVFASVSV